MTASPRIGGAFEGPEPQNANSGGQSLLSRGAPGSWLCSGRAAMTLLLTREAQRRATDTVHLPAFCCDSMVTAVRQAGLNFAFYDSASAADDTALPVIIHHFGWIETSPEHAVQDFSMALLSTAPPPSAPWFFSARKFGSFALGGWCSETIPTEPEPAAERIETTYADAAQHKRSGSPHTTFLPLFANAESQLDHLPAHAALPSTTARALDTCNWLELRTRRRTNWLHLHNALHNSGHALHHELPDHVTPLGYALHLPPNQRDSIRQALIQHQIFCPIHWPLPAAIDPAACPNAATRAASLLTLPIDQRYHPQQLDHLITRVQELLP